MTDKFARDYHQFKHRVSKKESGHNYRAVGKTPVYNKECRAYNRKIERDVNTGCRAYGRYQVMDYNVEKFTKLAVGISLTPEQLLNSPGIQEAVVYERFSYYWSIQPRWEYVASAWFCGEGASVAECKKRNDNNTDGENYINSIAYFN